MAYEAETARERLRGAVLQLECLRGETAAGPDANVPRLLGPDSGGGWTLVDRFECSGRHYVVALERPPGADHLSARECQALERAAGGATNKEIAYELGLTHATVRVLLHRATRKLGVRTRAALIDAFRVHSSMHILRD